MTLNITLYVQAFISPGPHHCGGRRTALSNIVCNRGAKDGILELNVYQQEFKEGSMKRRDQKYEVELSEEQRYAKRSARALRLFLTHTPASLYQTLLVTGILDSTVAYT